MMLAPTWGFAQTLSDAERSARVSLLSRADEARRANRLDEALSLIRQAEQIGPTAGTRMLSAQVLSQMGRHASALVAAEQCIREVEVDTQTTTANRAALRQRCEGLRDEARPRVVRLTVRVPSDAPAAMEVRVNDAVMRPALFNVEQVVDAGPLLVRVTLAGRRAWEHAQTLTEGASVAVDVEVPPLPGPMARTTPPAPRALRPVEATAPVVPVEAPPVETPSAPGSTQRAFAWVSGALGVALTGGAVVSGLMFLSRRGEYEQSGCVERQRTDACTTQYNQTVADLQPLDTLQYVGYIGGGVLLATSVVLFATAPSARSAPTLSLGVTPGGLSLGYGGHF